MAILEKEVWVGLGGSNAIYYGNLGYEIPKYTDESNRLKIKRGTKLLVKTSDLSPMSQVKVTKVCDVDNCGNLSLNQPYYAIMVSRKNNDGKDYCKQCASRIEGQSRKNNPTESNSLVNWAIKNGKEYLLEEYSGKNKLPIDKISYGNNDNVNWICKTCNGEYMAKVCNRTLLNRNCPFCSGTRTLAGFNDLWTTNPEIAKLLTDQEVGFRVSKGSKERVNFTCSRCGTVHYKRVNNVFWKGLSCNACSDGLSYPEKFLYNILTQLKVLFETQKEFDWSKYTGENKKLNGSKKYDFYINNLNTIIETHGGQHYLKGFEKFGRRSFKDEVENDSIKENLAKENGVTNYIVIDARESTLEWLSKSIMQSSLSTMFDLSKVNWEEAHVYSCKTLVREVCDLWNKGIKSSNQIGLKMNLHYSTVNKYLRQGAEIGWVNYKSRLNGRREIVQLTIDDELVNTWGSIIEASESLNVSRSKIDKALAGIHESKFGYKWMYKEDYDNLFQNV